MILGLLYKSERTGYEINEVFKKIFNHFYDASFGMIYPTLRKLEKQGLVEKKIVVQEGRPNKNVYSITDAGKNDFKQSLQTPLLPEIRRSDFLMRMYFGEYVTNSDLKQVLQSEIETKKELIVQLKENLSAWTQMSMTQGISFEIGIQQYQDEVEILEKYLKKLAKKNN